MTNKNNANTIYVESFPHGGMCAVINSYEKAIDRMEQPDHGQIFITDKKTFKNFFKIAKEAFFKDPAGWALRQCINRKITKTL